MCLKVSPCNRKGMSFLETWNFFTSQKILQHSPVTVQYYLTGRQSGNCNNFWTVSLAFHCVSAGTWIKSGNMDIISLADKWAAELVLLNTPVFWSRTFSGSWVHLLLASTREAASQTPVPQLCFQMVRQQEVVRWELETLLAWQADVLWVFWWSFEAESSVTIHNFSHLFSDLK